MTRIRASCPQCGEVDLRPADIELIIVGEDIDEVGSDSTYRFDCPTCDRRVSKPADQRIARLLATGGVSVRIRRPDVDTSRVEGALAELTLLLSHPEEPGLHPHLTHDDLLDFHQLLEDDDWFEQLKTVSS